MLVALVVFVVSLGVRLYGLDLTITTDEGYWMQRTARFGTALARGDFASTFRAGHPGVSVMWIGALGIGPAGLAPFSPDRFLRFELLERAPTYLTALADARRAIIVTVALLVTTAVLLSWRLFGAGAALAGGAALTLDPYSIGMTRLLHVDALLAPLMLVSMLAGLVYWTVSPRWPYLALSASMGGLALLTKAPAGLLPLFFGLVCITGAVGQWRAGHGGLRPRLRLLAPLIAWGLGAALVYFLLFPALWVDPFGRIVTLIEFVRAVGLEPHNGNFFLGQPVLDDPGPAYYLVALPLRLSPLVALGVGLLILKAPQSDNRRAIHLMLAYAILFVLLMSMASKKFDRYMLPALMALDVLAGVGLWRLAGLALPRWPSSHGKAALALAGMVAAGQLFLLARVWPYPIAFYNPLAGGPERARDLVMVGWGEGLEQVAAYLNALPGADELLVVTSYNHVVRPRFTGTTLPIAPYMRGARGLPSPDYVVLYVNAVQRRHYSPEIARAQALGPPVFVAYVNGLEYAWVYALPRAGPHPVPSIPIENDSEGEEN